MAMYIRLTQKIQKSGAPRPIGEIIAVDVDLEVPYALAQRYILCGVAVLCDADGNILPGGECP
jgi:hypothetical protein